MTAVEQLCARSLTTLQLLGSDDVRVARVQWKDLGQLPAPPGGRRPGRPSDPYLSHLVPPTWSLSVRSCWPLRRVGRIPEAARIRFLQGQVSLTARQGPVLTGRGRQAFQAKQHGGLPGKLVLRVAS